MGLQVEESCAVGYPRGMTIDKDRLIEALRQQARAELETLTESQRRAQEGATHEEARPENDKDTRATEASYLARGLAKRVQEMRGVLSALSALELRDFGPDAPIAAGALVELEDEEGTHSHLFIAPRGGGMKVEVDDALVKVVTPESPIGRALVGLGLDDEVRFTTPRDGERVAWIVNVA